MGTADRFAKDIVFGMKDSPAQHLASVGQLSAHDLDALTVDPLSSTTAFGLSTGK